jgi:hypothetical protein
MQHPLCFLLLTSTPRLATQCSILFPGPVVAPLYELCRPARRPRASLASSVSCRSRRCAPPRTSFADCRSHRRALPGATRELCGSWPGEWPPPLGEAHAGGVATPRWSSLEVKEGPPWGNSHRGSSRRPAQLWAELQMG